MLFADDLVLCANSAADPHELLNGLEQFSKKWHLIVSLAKTKVVVFNKKIVIETFIYNGNEVEMVNQYKYFQTIFSSDIVCRFKPGSKGTICIECSCE